MRPWAHETLQQPQCHDHRGGGISQTLGEDHELVTTDAGHGVLGSHRGAQTLGDVHEQLVADGVPSGIIDVLEAIKIAEHDGHGARVALQPRHRPAEPVLEGSTVRQTRERVERRLLRQGLLGDASQRHILELHDDLGRGAVGTA